MTYTEVPVTRDGLSRIWIRLWERGREEFERHGMGMLDAYWMFLNYEGRKGILEADGDPILIAGIAKDDSGYFTYFQATDDFDRHALAITKCLRKNVKAHEGQLHIYSVCVHPKTERWFKALGFTKDDWEGRTRAGFPLYRFGRSVCA